MLNLQCVTKCLDSLKIKFLTMWIVTIKNDILAGNLNSYLRMHTNVWNMCCLPVYAGIICFLYKSSKDRIPDTETEV